MNRVTQVILTFLLVVVLGFVIWYLNGVGPIDPPPSCGVSATCPAREPDILSRGIVISFKNFYTEDHITMEADSFIVGYCGRDSTLSILGPKDIRCTPVDTVYTGEKAFLRYINMILVGEGKPYVIDSLDSLKIESCKCAADIILLEIPDTFWNNPTIESRVASGTSKTKKESNDIFGAVGFNHDLSQSIAAYDDLIQPEPRPAEPCGVKLELGDYKPASIDPKSEISITYARRMQDRLERIDGGQREKWNCGSAPVVNLGGATTTDAQQVVVAIIDTGVDPNYDYLNSGRPAYQDSFFAFTDAVLALGNTPLDLTFDYGESIPFGGSNQNGDCLLGDYYGYDYFNGDNNPSDNQGHGTFVASVVLSANSAADHPVKIVPLQFGDMEKGAFEGSLFAAVCALNYATERGVDIINMSWGYTSPDTSEVLMRQIEAAYAADILMVASAGNDTSGVDSCYHWPSAFSAFEAYGRKFISVAALDSSGTGYALQLADYSNYGQSIDLAAPGTNLPGALLHSSSGTIRLSGTSMAAAFISRKAAILKQSSGTRLSAEELKGAIFSRTFADNTACLAGGRLYNEDASLSYLDLLRR